MSRSVRASRTGPTTAELEALLDGLRLDSPAHSDAARIDRITAIERLKNALTAAQVAETVTFTDSQRADQRDKGVRAERLGRGIGSQIALARQQSPRQGARFVGLARMLTDEMPSTLAAMRAGTLSEWRATIVARETACLSREHRLEVDRRIGPTLSTLGDGQLGAQLRELAYELDPHAFLNRHAAAVTDRHVALRPAPDGMSWLSALLPLTQGVAVLAALGRTADSARAAGDPRRRGQVMADSLVERLTGQRTAEQTPVEIQLLITDHALVGHSDAPALLAGHGPIPAALARELLRGLADDTATWLRRIFMDTYGTLRGLDSRRRAFSHAQRQAIIVRDQYCRTPWCGAPIRHIDHVEPYGDGGPTTTDNGQGLCEACNYAKQAPGWIAQLETTQAVGSLLTVTTPTGHAYSSRPPPLPGIQSPREPELEAGRKEPPSRDGQPEWYPPRVEIVYAARHAA